MKKMPITFFNSFKDADEAALKEALAMKPEERVAAVDAIRRNLYNIKHIQADNRVVRCISFAKRHS